MSQDNPYSNASNSAGGSPTYQGSTPTSDETNMAMLMYLLGIFTGFIGPLILWLVKKDQSKFLDDQGKEVLNFQITTIIALLVSVVLMIVVIGFFLYFAILIAHLVFLVIGAIQVKSGVAYRFPVTLRLIK